MLKRIVLIPYKMGSESCKKLKEELNKHIPTIRVRPERYRHIQKEGDLVIGWGTPGGIGTNKLRFFKAAEKVTGLNIPEWTTDINVARDWCKNHPHKYEIAGFARTNLTGHSGQGMVEFYHACEYSVEGNIFPTAPLYVKYIKKTQEYRVHVFAGQVIDIVQKKRRANTENVNSQIRSHANGWVFCREDLKINNKNDLSNQALLACNAAGLNFGAVDIIYNAKQKKYYVLEVNTAPGLEGQTVTKYTEAILNYIKQV